MTKVAHYCIDRGAAMTRPPKINRRPRGGHEAAPRRFIVREARAAAAPVDASVAPRPRRFLQPPARPPHVAARLSLPPIAAGRRHATAAPPPSRAGARATRRRLAAVRNRWQGSSSCLGSGHLVAVPG
ncbi:unnamed protein product [Parnassius apollo]|uniref:(apollo) hypothetical protein n=1 Tax=Parnassius apollo TaxID=110799 RepID=A0A8S3W043_PARAO|nr:unnamed protein product [Parnassius apollo]